MTQRTSIAIAAPLLTRYTSVAKQSPKAQRG
jgi:hypothetical protein